MKDRFWSDLNRELWRAATDGMPPRNFIRAELWRRVEQMRRLEKSAAIRMAQKTRPVSATYRACRWLIETGPIGEHLQYPTQDARTPENAAIPQQWPTNYPGIDIQNPAQQADETDHYNIFIRAFIFAAQAAQLVGLDPKSFEFAFDFSKHRWIVQGSDSHPFARILVNFFYVSAPPKIWNALFTAIVKNHTPSRSIAEKYAQSSDAQSMLAIYADISPLKIHDVYNLSDLFDQLNADFFNHALPKPILAWTSREQYHTLGSYNYHWDIILISRIFNNQRMPEFVVRFILYHEMLHIKHGAYRNHNGLRSHTPAFRADERAFPQYEEAEEFLKHIREFVTK